MKLLLVLLALSIISITGCSSNVVSVKRKANIVTTCFNDGTCEDERLDRSRFSDGVSTRPSSKLSSSVIESAPAAKSSNKNKRKSHKSEDK